MILQRYAAAINSVVIVVLSALLAIPSGMLNWTSATQLVSIGLSGVLLYILPLLNVSWRGILKTGVAIVGAAVAAGFPIFQTVVDGQPFKPIYIALIVLAVAHALGTQVGVDIRTDTAATLPVDNTPTESSANQEFDEIIAPPTAQQDAVQAGYFAAGAGFQDPTINTATTSAASVPVEYASYGESPMYNGATTAELEVVNPANAEE